MHKCSIGIVVAFALAVSIGGNAANATEYTFSGVFNYLQNLSANENGQTPGVSNFFGITCAVPVGTSCDDFNADHSGTVATAVQGSTSRTLTHSLLTVAPNFWSRSVSIAPADTDTVLTGEWTIHFANGGDDTTVVTPTRGDTTPFPFVQNVTITTAKNANGILEPTLSWSLPANTTVNVARVNVFDLDHQISTGVADVILSHDLDGSVTSFTIAESDVALKQNNRYEFEVSIAQTRDGTSAGGNANFLNRSRGFFSFTLPDEGEPDIHLPTVDPHGGPQGQPVYHFNVSSITAGEAIFIDPIVAIGYDYEIGAGDPNFASVLLPDVGDGVFELWLFDDADNPFDSGFAIQAGISFDFLAEIDAAGIDKFRILGIEQGAGLDPNNPLAFLTGLTFVGDGSFTGTMTPLVAEVAAVPAPAGWPLLLLAWCGLALVGRQARRG